MCISSTVQFLGYFNRLLRYPIFFRVTLALVTLLRHQQLLRDLQEFIRTCEEGTNVLQSGAPLGILGPMKRMV